MRVGIDLGTTFCCVVYIDPETGQPHVIPNADDATTMPSVVWTDGQQACVGERANQLKMVAPHNIFEFVKRDMGKPFEIPPHLYEEDDPKRPEAVPCKAGGFSFGPEGISAIILRKLKRDVIQFFKREGMLPKDLDEKNIELEAVITVPAYFDDIRRQLTKDAGYAAGLNVIGIINEPTAAAFAYGLGRQDPVRVMVFDLGGGTFDVTILELSAGDKDKVLSTDGDRELGGKDVDDLIIKHLNHVYYKHTSRSLPSSQKYLIQQAVLEAKLGLSTQEVATVAIQHDGEDLQVALHRAAPLDSGFEFDMDGEDETFYLDQRMHGLLHRIRVLCERALESAYVATSWGAERKMTWKDLDEIILAGGSCRMPVIHERLEEWSGKSIRRHIEGFDYDTAIAIGAALHSVQQVQVQDVVSHSIGVKLKQNDRFFVEHLIRKNEPLSVHRQKNYHAGPNAELEIYQGERSNPEECLLRGRLVLDNEEGPVTVTLSMDENGILSAAAEFPPHGRREVPITNLLYPRDERRIALREKVQSLRFI